LKVSQGLAYNNGEFDFIVKIHALGSYNWTSPWQDDGRGGLEEEERLVRPHIIQFLDVFPKQLLATSLFM
jgi:hypothetical protein